MKEEYYPEKFIKLIQPQKSLNIFYNENNINNRRIHIRAIVDEYQIVYRVWSKRYKSWRYRVESIEYFYMLFENNHLIQK